MALNIPASVYRDSTPPDLTPEQEPFPKPNDPMEIRRDISKRTSQDLFREYFQTRPKDEVQSNAYRQAVLELALGIINKDEKFLGYFDFAVWYYNLLEKEGYVEEKNAEHSSR